MESSGGLRNRLKWITRHIDTVVPLLSMIVAGALTLWATSDHIVIEYDSVYYLSSGENLAHGVGLVEYTGGQLSNFPPGYPMLIALLVILGFGSTTAAQIINVVSAMAIVWLASRIARHVGPRTSAAWTALVLAAVPASVVMHAQAMSEPVFTVSLLALILQLVKIPAPPDPVGWRHVAPLAGITWVCCLLRYQGYAVLVAAIVVLLLQKRPWLDRIANAAKYYALAFLGVLGVVLQNVIRSGTLGGPVTDARETFSSDVRASLVALGRLFSRTYDWASEDTGIVAGLVVVGVVFVATVAGFVLMRRSEGRLRLRVLPVFLIVLPVFTFASARRVWVEFSPRIFFPLVPVLVVLGICMVVSTAMRLPRLARFTLPVLGVVIVAMFGSSTITAADHLSSTVDEFNRPEILVPELGRAVADLPNSAVVYSNNAEGIWLSSRVPRVRRYDIWAWRVTDLLEPSPDRQPPKKLVKRLWRLADHMCSGFYLAWTDLENSKRGGGDFDMLERIAVTTLVHEFEGGALYFVKNAVPGLCERVDEHEGSDQLL